MYSMYVWHVLMRATHTCALKGHPVLHGPVYLFEVDRKLMCPTAGTSPIQTLHRK